MRIRQVHIDGYGIYADFTLPDLHPNLVVFKGANEAGKSTLLWFIRQVLFGYPDRRQREPTYPPLRGGRFGGWLKLVDSNSTEYHVERREGRGGGALIVQLSDGEAGTLAALDRLLAGVQADVFRSVFAFSLEELSQLQGSFGDEVQSHIYGAGITGRGPHILDVEKRLESETRGLLSPRSGRIRELLTAQRHLEQELADLRKGVARYDQLVLNEGELRNWLEEHGPELANMRHRLSYLEGAWKAWEPWVSLRTAESKLEELHVIEEFPDDGVNRLEQLEEGLREFEARKIGLEHRIRTAQDQIEQITVDEDLLKEAHQLQSLYRRVDHYLSARKDLPILNTQWEEATTSVQQTLADLGADWTEERVLTFDVSVPTHGTVRQHRHAILQAEQDLRTTQQAVAQRREEVEHVEQALRQWRQRLEQLPPPTAKDAGEAQARITAARMLLQGARSVDASQKELRHQKARLDDLKRQLNLSQRTSRLGPIVSYKAVGLFLLIALAGVGLAATGERVGGAVLAGVGLLLALLLLYLRRGFLSPQPVEEVADHLREELGSLEREIERTGSALQVAQDAVAEQAGFLGISPASDPYAAEELLNRVTRDEQVLQRREDARAQVDEAEVSLKAAKERLKEAEGEMKRAQALSEHASMAWSDWLVRRGLAPELFPDTVLEMFRLIQVARERINTKNGLAERVKRVGVEMTGFHARLTSLLQACGRPESVPEDAAAAVQKLQSELETTRESRRKVSDLRDRVQQDKDELTALERRLAETQDEMDALLRAARASDAEEFRHRARVYGSRKQLRVEVEKQEGAVKIISGPGEAYDRLCNFLTNRDASRLKVEIIQVREQLTEQEQQERQFREKIGEVRAQITGLEAQGDTSAKLLEHRQNQERLSIAVRNWAVASAALYTLSQARRDYEREHQPLVIRAAEGFFSTITGGRYPRLFVSAESREIQVEVASGERKTVAQLSRGTAEQLYLAMRLGLVSHMGRSGEPLPVIMDDVLVNFDPERAEQTCLALAELSKASQILYFTCHPETAGYLEHAARGSCQIIPLSL